MSSVGEGLGVIVGGAIGFAVAGPAGAAWGMQIGMAVGGAIEGGQTIQGFQVGEAAAQTSQEGVPRPIVWGIARPIGGNIIATTAPIIRTRTERVGGNVFSSGEKIRHEEVYRTYAIRICEGPITGIRRVWRNNKLVYDETSDSETARENRAEFLRRATFHLGHYDQPPDPVLQAAFGADNVPAHRGTAYMVIDDEDLTELGGAIPQYQFEVERCTVVYTSRPYALEAEESATTVDAGADRGPYAFASHIEDAATAQAEITDGELRSLVVELAGPQEDATTAQAEIPAGTLELDGIVILEDAAREDATTADTAVVAGEFREVVIAHDKHETEDATTASAEITTGVLENAD